MNPEQREKGAIALLEQMSEDPNVILQHLDETEQLAMVKDLDMLVERAATIQSGADLLKLVDAIYHLIESRPRLEALLLPKETDAKKKQFQRSVTLADQRATNALNDYTQRRAAMIHNTIITCRKQLKDALQIEVESEHKPLQGKSHGN